jgi:hypothetical protein
LGLLKVTHKRDADYRRRALPERCNQTLFFLFPYFYVLRRNISFFFLSIPFFTKDFLKSSNTTHLMSNV